MAFLPFFAGTLPRPSASYRLAGISLPAIRRNQRIRTGGIPQASPGN
jgi:hypothetical protein